MMTVWAMPCDPDADDDGTLSENDRDDLDATSTIISEDEDCDGVLSAVDCNDFDASVTLSLTEDPICGAMRSLRLSEDHQTYLERTFGPSVDDRKKTFSWWQNAPSSTKVWGTRLPAMHNKWWRHSDLRFGRQWVARERSLGHQ